MRYRFFILGSLLILCSFSCSKSSDSLVNPGCCCATVPGDLSGSWELRSWYGGFSATSPVESEAGNGNTYTFADHHYQRYENHVLRDSGTFSLTTSRGPENGDPISAIAFSAGDTLGYVFRSDTLVIDPRAPWYDGIAKSYVKIGN